MIARLLHAYPSDTYCVRIEDGPHTVDRILTLDEIVAHAAAWNQLMSAAMEHAGTGRVTDHQQHYRTCNCLADSSECCRPECSCHRRAS